MTDPQTALTDRPDLGAALERAGDSEILRTAAVAVVEGLGVDEIVLEAATTKASGVDGAAFVTNRRILVSSNKKTHLILNFLSLTTSETSLPCLTKAVGPSWHSSTPRTKCGVVSLKKRQSVCSLLPSGP